MQGHTRARTRSSRPSTSPPPRWQVVGEGARRRRRRAVRLAPRYLRRPRPAAHERRCRIVLGGVASARRAPGSREGRGGRRRGGGDVGDAGGGVPRPRQRLARREDRVRARGSFVLCVLLEGNIVLERPITVAPAPTDAPSCELQITAQMVRGNLELRAGEELVFSVAPRDRYGNASGGAPTAAAKTFSWALAPPKRKEEEVKEAAGEIGRCRRRRGGGGRRVGEGRRRWRAPRANGRPLARAPTAAAAAALDGALSEGGPTARCHPLVESGDFDLLVHHKLGGEPPALVKATRLRVLPATIDVPEATLHGSGMHPCRLRRLRQRRA